MYTPKPTYNDVVDVRFAYSPMFEVITSFRLYQSGQDAPGYYYWLEEARQALSNLALPMMHALILPYGNIPDFLTPLPIMPDATFEGELERIRNLPANFIQRDLETWLGYCEHAHLNYNDSKYGNSKPNIDYLDEQRLAIIEAFMVNPHEALTHLLAELREYWARVLEPHWQRLHAVLDSNILHGARQLALGGASAVLNDLVENVHFDGHSNMIYNKQHREHAIEISVVETGVQIVPIVFSLPHIYWQFADNERTLLGYGARGRGLWYQHTPESNQQLAIALGTGRAQVLQMLIMPATTSEIARQLHVTAGAISQHLTRLNQAGLVETYRIGKRVYYRLSDRGDQLIQLFS